MNETIKSAAIKSNVVPLSNENSTSNVPTENDIACQHVNHPFEKFKDYEKKPLEILLVNLNNYLIYFFSEICCCNFTYLLLFNKTDSIFYKEKKFNFITWLEDNLPEKRAFKEFFSNKKEILKKKKIKTVLELGFCNVNNQTDTTDLYQQICSSGLSLVTKCEHEWKHITLQTRSADEASTTIYTCYICGITSHNNPFNQIPI
jgi:DNA-directed RNA polymerase subunit M/transcription elongation factor TFIIS